VSQQPIKPGERFRYRFTLPDAGTYWYHPHFQSQEQVVRGLYGPFIIEETKPIEVDHDLTWVLADWLVDNAGALRTDFDDPRDMSHAGRLGNLITVNGQQEAPATTLAAGSRVRLRLVNAASARIFLLQFENANPTVIAYDGQPVTPHALPGDRLLLGPAMRADLIIDMPAAVVRVIDRVDARRPATLRELSGIGAARDRGPVVALPPNPLPEPDMARARRFEVVLEGGARGTLNSALVNGKPTPIAAMVREHGLGWAMNGIANAEHNHAPLLALARNESALISIINRTEWPHPMHLHGHAFRVMSMNGKPTRHREWRDTVLVEPKGSAEIAFVADNPGDWMFHCHILQHQRGGMMGSIQVK
jgi:FtsP/CotA-like multicopper oxidase with cupredoxin domain